MDDWMTVRGIPRTQESAVILAVPDVRQGDDYSCGGAALTAVFRYWRTPRRLWLDMVRGLPNPVQGMSPDTLEAVLHTVYGRPPVRGSLSVADLRHLTRTLRPVVCPITAERDDGSRGGHWVVVRGVERGRVHYHCPTNGPESLATAEWLARWTDESPGGSVYHRFGVCGWPDPG